MSIADTNSIIRSYLTTSSVKVDPLITLVGARIYCPRLPENASLPAISFFTRGGTSTPYIPGLVNPSVQFDCWADNPITARQVYRLLYDALQGIQNIATGTIQGILSAIEEVQGQDLVDNEIQDYFRVMTFFEVMIRAE